MFGLDSYLAHVSDGVVAGATTGCVGALRHGSFAAAAPSDVVATVSATVLRGDSPHAGTGTTDSPVRAGS